MVFLPVLLGRESLAEAITRMTTPRDPARVLRGVLGMSQRTFSIRTGLPRTTLQDFLRDPSRARASTVKRIADALESPAMRIETRGVNTVRVDAPIFSLGVLSQLQPPEPGAAYRYVYEAEGYTDSGFATSGWLLDGRPEDELSLMSVPGGWESVRRVVWSIGE